MKEHPVKSSYPGRLWRAVTDNSYTPSSEKGTHTPRPAWRRQVVENKSWQDGREFFSTSFRLYSIITKPKLSILLKENKPVLGIPETVHLCFVIKIISKLTFKYHHWNRFLETIETYSEDGFLVTITIEIILKWRKMNLRNTCAYPTVEKCTWNLRHVNWHTKYASEIVFCKKRYYILSIVLHPWLPVSWQRCCIRSYNCYT